MTHLADHAAAVRAGIDHLGPRDREFASSLLDQLGRRGLSEKQAHWLAVLASRAKPAAAAPRIAADVAPIVALFAKAGATLARPAVVISSADAGEIRLSVAGASSREPGSIIVTTAGSFVDRTFLGRIRRDGSWAAAAAVEARGIGPALEALLARFAADPAGVASEHGKMTGACSFCARPLTDARSVAAGFGPICADRYGLAWGDRAAA